MVQRLKIHVNFILIAILATAVVFPFLKEMGFLVIALIIIIFWSRKIFPGTSPSKVIISGLFLITIFFFWLQVSFIESYNRSSCLLEITGWEVYWSLLGNYFLFTILSIETIFFFKKKSY